MAIKQDILPIEEEVLGLPVLGWIYERLFAPNTFYIADTALMFQESVRRSVNDVLDGLFTEQGLQALSDSEKLYETRDFAG